MNIRKIIKETLENLVSKQEIIQKFDDDIKYLNGFKLIKSRIDSRVNVWVFEHKSKNYILRFFIEEDKKKKTWTAKVIIYWKEVSKNFTNAKGKEYEHVYGPFNDYNLMVDELNDRLKNNPNLSVINFKDDNRSQFDKDLIHMLKILKRNGDMLYKVQDNHFDNLKKIFKEIEGLKTDEELKKYIDDNAYDTEEKQELLMKLQNLYRLDFFLKKEELDSFSDIFINKK